MSEVSGFASQGRDEKEIDDQYDLMTSTLAESRGCRHAPSAKCFGLYFEIMACELGLVQETGNRLEAAEVLRLALLNKKFPHWKLKGRKAMRVESSFQSAPESP